MGRARSSRWSTFSQASGYEVDEDAKLVRVSSEVDLVLIHASMYSPSFFGASRWDLTSQ